MSLFFRKWVLKPIIILLIWVVGLVGVGTIVLLAQQERLVKLGVKELNKQIKGELVVGTSKISLFKHFPSVGVSLREGQLFADKAKSGTPFVTFERLYVGISIPDLMSGKYNLRRLSLTNGQLALIRATDGNINLVEAFSSIADSTSSTSTSTGAFDINLQKISIKGTHISYVDSGSGQKFETAIEQLTSSFTMRCNCYMSLGFHSLRS